MRLIEKMLSKRNMELAIKKVKSNKGAPGVDNMMVEEIDKYFEIHGEEIITAIMNMKYKPKPVRRVYIPKADGKQRPLGIPTVTDRVIPVSYTHLCWRPRRSSSHSSSGRGMRNE